MLERVKPELFCRSMSFPLKFFLIACFYAFCSQSLFAGSVWRTYDNKTEIDAVATHFDFETKDVTLTYLDTETHQVHNTKDLDFKSRQKLLLTTVFQNSLPSGFTSPEKLWYYGLAIFSPVLLLIVGMWLSALFIAKKFNPFKALGAFLGSWIAGIILMACYRVFAAKSGDSGTGFIIAGMLIATVVMALFISAVYKTTFFKGLFIFVAHMLFAGLVGYLLIFSADVFFPKDEVSAFWDQWVFSKVGLIEKLASEGY